ncbi:hypothetical protein QM012_001699 [Aureobasidium pullulans]|uniref:Zn(2)-C6 fungal-type domain-containing protein n=1 Tax=Aureobasidium pullulans TaxID=5580 RepID=A0ABR0TDQ7_AURPU
MEEPFDYGVDLLSDRASFQALIDELYPSEETMQLDVEFSSRGTSPPGPDTPPSSSDAGQEEVGSLDEEHEHQAFAPGALMTEMLAGIRGSAPHDLVRLGSHIYPDLNTIESSSHEPYLNVPSSSQDPHCQMPAYTWDTFPERPPQHGTVYGTSFSWIDPPAINLNNPNLVYRSSDQAFFDPTTFIPRSTMPPPHIAYVHHSTAAASGGFNTGQDTTSLTAFQHDGMLMAYQDLSSADIMTTHAGYNLNDSPPELAAFDLVQQPAVLANHQTDASTNQQQHPTANTNTIAVADGDFPAVETAYLPIRNNYRTREQPTSQSPEVTRRGIASRTSSSRGSSPKPAHKGGRSGGLDGNTRAHANQMRKLGACWICAFQRDQCDPGSPCTRCQDRSIRGSLHMLPCSRMHLQDLVHQFLPATMNRQHRRDEVLSFAKKSLGFWRADAPIQVRLTSLGMGHFTWDLHEYEPSSQDLLLQKRYKVGISGAWQRTEKRSPPLALKQINFTQSHRLEDYVDIIVDQYLEMFQKQAYYGEEDLCAMFQNEMLGALCNLYTSLPDEDDDKTLKGDLRHVLRMLILTCIMDHPITISESALPATISSMHSHNNPHLYSSWTSPFLANRQLKYFFAEMQTQQYNRTLNRLHQILRKAGDKSKLWMSSFVLMLGIAIVLENCQHLLWIKADAKVARKETTPVDAAWEARSHCQEMDDGFEFLCKLYHCKYRGKHRQKTRYEELKNKTSRPAEQAFADRIYEIVDRNGGYLLHRQNLTVNGMQDNNHASRLVARFLVELMGLTQSSP